MPRAPHSMTLLAGRPAAKLRVLASRMSRCRSMPCSSGSATRDTCGTGTSTGFGAGGQTKAPPPAGTGGGGGGGARRSSAPAMRASRASGSGFSVIRLHFTGRGRKLGCRCRARQAGTQRNSLGMLISPAYAQDAAGGMAMVMQIAPLLLIFGVFYFLLIRPQQKKQKEHKALLASIKRGDRVLTAGGIIAQVTRVKEGVDE